MPLLSWILAVASLVVTGWAAVRAIRDQPVITRQLIVAGAVLAGFLVLAVVAGVQIVSAHPLADGVVFWGYFITGALVYPLAAVWAMADRTRWSSVVLAVAGVTFAVVQLRLVQLWNM